MLTEEVLARVKLEIEQINQLFTAYSDLLGRMKKRIPTTVEIAALASILHSFYNGVENIFLSIAKAFDKRVPAGNHWHRDLLVQMSEKTNKRRAVISREVAENLGEYLGFRHFFRHAYSFFLDWRKLRNLVVLLPENWAHLKDQLEEFMNTQNTSKSTPRRKQ